MSTPVTWYSISLDLRPVDQGTVCQQKALTIVDGYISQLGGRWENGKTALAETMFGFERGKGVMLELCLHGPRQISSTFEIMLPRKILFLNTTKTVSIRRTLRSVDELKHSIKRFFELDPERFLEYKKLLK